MAYPTPYPVPPAPAPQENQMVQQLSMPIYQARGWLKFLGVMTIISGIPSVFVLVGILQIWIGILLFQAGSSIESAGQFGDKFAFLRSMGGLKTYFIIQGVLTLIGIIVAVTMLCITFVLPLLGLTLIPWQQIVNNSIQY
jgi:Family of unknown function (DUF5362)